MMRKLRDLLVLALSIASTNSIAEPNLFMKKDHIIAQSTATMTHVKTGSRWRRQRKPETVIKETPQNHTAIAENYPSEKSEINNPIPEEKLDISHVTRYVAECRMPTDQGTYRMRSYIYDSSRQHLEPIAMIYGDISKKEKVLVRVHDQCFTSEVFGSLRCDCRQQLKESLRAIKEQGGIVIYLQQEGRGIGIANKVAAYALQDQGLDTVDANIHLGFKDELREYLAIPDILADLGIKSIRLMTNNPYKMQQLQDLGVTIEERIPIQVSPNTYNERYLRVKRDKMRHFLSDEVLADVKNAGGLKGGRSFTTGNDNGIESNVGSIGQEHLIAAYEAEEEEDQLQQAKDMLHRIEKSDTATSTAVTSQVFTKEECTYALGKETVLAAIEAMAQGQLVIVVDDANRENEGDLIMAAEKATPEKIGFMVRYTSGVLCVSLPEERLQSLALPPMVVNNEDPKQTAYTVSVDYKYNTSTGISAADRALTFNQLVNMSAKVDDFQRPGHVFPLRYKPGGVLARMGHTEASLDLSTLAGLSAGGVLAEIVHNDGSMMRLPELIIFAKEHGLVLTSVHDIKAYRIEIKHGPSCQEEG